MVLFFLSESNPLRWASIRFNGQRPLLSFWRVRDLHRPGQYGITKDRIDEKVARLMNKEMQHQALISDVKQFYVEKASRP